MTNRSFRQWMRRNGLSEATAAKKLGVSLRTIWTYLSRPDTPHTLALACCAIDHGYGRRARRQKPSAPSTMNPAMASTTNQPSANAA
jgi:DNA-binding XRE family transcriptional regulator